MAEHVTEAGAPVASGRLLARHTLGYLLARGLPAVVNFAAIAVYTRLLPPMEYGTYALLLAAASLGNAIGFQWLYLGLTRHLPLYPDRRRELMSTVLAAFGGLLVVCLGSAAVASLALPGMAGRGQVWLGAGLLCALAWYQLNLELQRGDLQPRRYGILAMLRAVSCLGLGTLGVVLSGRRAEGLVLGAAAGYLLPTLLRRDWRGCRLGAADRAIMREMLRYGLPLTLTASLAIIIYNGDRFFIQHFLGREWVGLYAAGYDLAEQTIIMSFTAIGLPAAPLLFRAMQQGDLAGAKRQFLANGRLFAAVTVPVAVGLFVLTEPLVGIAVGPQYRAAAARIFPWIVLAAFLQGVKFYYLDTCLYLVKRTKLLLVSVVPAAIVNVSLNLLLLPRIGIMGAAYATAAAYLLALVIAVIITAGVLRMPVAVGAFARTGTAAAGMAAGMLATQALLGPGLVAPAAVGAACYGGLLWLLRGRGRRTGAPAAEAGSRPAIVLANERFSANLGDGIIAECLAGTLRQAGPGLEIRTLDLSGRTGYRGKGQEPGGMARALHRRLLAWPLYRSAACLVKWWLSTRPRLLAACRQVMPGAGLVVIGGGQLLMENDLGFPLAIRLVTSTADACGVPVAVHACGVGRSWSWLARRLFGASLTSPGVVAVSLRDEASRANLQRHLPNLPVKATVTVDPACWAGRLYEKTPAGRQIGLGVMSAEVLGRDADGLLKTDAEGLVRFWCELAQVVRAAGYTPRLLTNGLAGDYAFAEQVAAALPWKPEERAVLLLPRPGTPEELASQVGACQGLVACRLHANLLAFALGVPAVALVWEEKVRQYGALCGHPEWCLPGPLDAGAVWEGLRQAMAAGQPAGPLGQAQAAAEEAARELVGHTGATA